MGKAGMKVLYMVVKAIVWVVRIFQWLASCVFYMVYEGRKEKLPRITDEVLFETASSLARKIRKRELTSEAVVQSYIARIKEVNPIINALVKQRFREAQREARRIDELLDSGDAGEEYSEQSKPFLGVPVSIKECFAMEGMPQSSGLVSRKQLRCSEDALVVERIKASGAIALGVTNVSELCMWMESANWVYGRTKNAYNSTRLVGGSSGGEGALISAAGSVMGLGSDIGGSIRLPAFFNGIFGHKPSPGVVPNDGQYPTGDGEIQQFLLGTGPLCRYASDLVPLLKVMAGPNISKLKLDTQVDVSKVRVYSMVDNGGVLESPVDTDLKNIQAKVEEYLRSNIKCSVESTRIKNLRHSLALWACKMGEAQERTFCELMGDGDSLNAWGEFFKHIVGRSEHTLPAIGLGMVESFGDMPAKTVEKLTDIAENLQTEIKDLLGDDGVLLYPTHPKVTYYHNEALVYPTNFPYTGIFNVLGVPVTQVPLGLGKLGQPLGIQVVTTPYNDHLSLAVARQLEKGFGGWVPPS